MIGDVVRVTVDRPLGSYHPEHKEMYYPINYGYVEEKWVVAPLDMTFAESSFLCGYLEIDLVQVWLAPLSISLKALVYKGFEAFVLCHLHRSYTI